jgi:hypothetical protein
MSKEEEWDQVGVLVWLIIVFGIPIIVSSVL